MFNVNNNANYSLRSNNSNYTLPKPNTNFIKKSSDLVVVTNLNTIFKYVDTMVIGNLR